LDDNQAIHLRDVSFDVESYLAKQDNIQGLLQSAAKRESITGEMAQVIYVTYFGLGLNRRRFALGHKANNCATCRSDVHLSARKFIEGRR
jgi:hypothetical protein